MNEVRQQVATVLDGAKQRITRLNRKRLILAVTISTLWAISAVPEQLETRSSADVILSFLVFFPTWCALVYLALSGLETWRRSRRADKQPKAPSTPLNQDTNSPLWPPPSATPHRPSPSREMLSEPVSEDRDELLALLLRRHHERLQVWKAAIDQRKAAEQKRSVATEQAKRGKTLASASWNTTLYEGAIEYRGTTFAMDAAVKARIVEPRAQKTLYSILIDSPEWSLEIRGESLEGQAPNAGFLAAGAHWSDGLDVKRAHAFVSAVNDAARAYPQFLARQQKALADDKHLAEILETIACLRSIADTQNIVAEADLAQLTALEEEPAETSFLRRLFKPPVCSRRVLEPKLRDEVAGYVLAYVSHELQRLGSVDHQGRPAINASPAAADGLADDPVKQVTHVAEKPSDSAPSRAAPRDPIDQIKRLGELRDSGLLTPEEFETKKADLLGRL